MVGVAGNDEQNCDPIRLSAQLTWEPFHGWLDGHSTWIDGRLNDGNGRRHGLDIGAVGDECCAGHLVDVAQHAWDVGGVYVQHTDTGTPVALIIPAAHVTRELVEEALRRFGP